MSRIEVTSRAAAEESARAAMTWIFLVVFIGSIAGLVLGILPRFGIGASSSVSFHEQPAFALAVALGALIGIVALGYVSAVAAAWVALRRYDAAAVKAGFRWLLSWFRWDPDFHETLFNRLFVRGS